MHRLQRGYFEGWYFKAQNAKEALALIPAFFVEENGTQRASVQVVTQKGSYVFSYTEDFCMERDEDGFPVIQIGENYFDRHECHILLRRKDITIRGKLSMSLFQKPKYSVMGPLEKAFFLPCKHEVFSLHHQVNGVIWINDKRLLFTGAAGYVEGDRGHSFPERYLWTQCSFPAKKLQSIMAAAAYITPWNYCGCMCLFLYRNKEYRMASYLGARVVYHDEKSLVIKQRSYQMEITCVEEGTNQELTAPRDGRMSRVIKESIGASVRYRFSNGGKVLFEVTGNPAGFESEGMGWE